MTIWRRLWTWCMNADTEREAALLDAWLRSRAARPLWLGAWLVLLLLWTGLLAVGAGPLLAPALALLFVAGSLAMARRAWLQPERFQPRQLLRLGGIMMIASYATGALTSMDPALRGTPWTAQRLLDVLWRATPLQLLLGLTLLLMLAVVAQRRRGQIERESVARRAAEAQLQLLRAQIQPHFIFNTLAALQHWVDTGDARAPALLRALTGFLRRSTELLARSEATLADELALARLYAEIMQSRLGERLVCHFDVASAALAQPLPPGLLLTLLENAIEHGITPALHPGPVQVRATQDGGLFTLDVQDGGAGLAPGWHEGLGLTNCRERLQHHFGNRATLSLAPAADGGTLARLTLRH